MAEHLYVLAHAALLFAVIIALTIAGIYVMKRFRGNSGDEESLTNDMTTTFREIHGRGDLSEEEYRTIKTVLEERSRTESSDSGERG